MIRSVLMDIEGTILPVDFVRTILFPYSQKRMAAFLRAESENLVVRGWAEVCQDTVAEETGRKPLYEELPTILDRWIEEDRKHPGLKALQGMIWREGYQSGAFAPALYDDVVPRLTSWWKNGLRLALYSSGSEQAQRLLIEHTADGNLTGLFSYFFDTRIGAKTQAASYRKIAETMALPCEEILFLSDAEPELDAAAAAGLMTLHIIRPGTNPGERHLISSTFEDLSWVDSAMNHVIAP
jgi:enolase-phosphatase E1